LVQKTGCLGHPHPNDTGAGQTTHGLPIDRTGAVYAVSYPGDPGEIPGFPAATPGDFVNPEDAIVLGWNQYQLGKYCNAPSMTWKVPRPAMRQFRPGCYQAKNNGKRASGAGADTRRPSSSAIAIIPSGG
jgi:hypothetical protein